MAKKPQSIAASVQDALTRFNIDPLEAISNAQSIIDLTAGIVSGDPKKRLDAVRRVQTQRKKSAESTYRRAAQVVQGAALPFVDSPTVTTDRKTGKKKTDKRFAGYSPVAVDMIPAAVNDIASLVNPNFNAPYLSGASERVQAANESLNAGLGITDPRDPLELAMNVAGSMALPLPLPKGGQSSGIAEDVARFAAESLIPFRQSEVASGTTAAAQLLPQALVEGIDATYQSPDYKSALEVATGRDDQALAPEAEDTIDASALPDPDEFTTDEAPIDVDALPDPDAYEVGEISLEDQLPDPDAYEEATQPAWKSPLAIGAGIAATGLGAFGISKLVRGMTKSRLTGTSALTGARTVPNTTDWQDAFLGATVQADQPVRGAMRKATGQTPSEINAIFDPVTNPALQTKIGHTLRTGEFPNSSVTVPSTGAVLEAIAKDLDPAEYNVLMDGLLARNALDDLKANGVQSSFEGSTPADLTAMATRVENDPKLAKYADAVVGQYRGILDYAKDRGLISPETYNDLVTKRGRYVHISRNDISNVASTGLFDAVRNNESVGKLNAFLKRSDDEFSGVRTGEAADPIAELTGQISRIIRVGEVNDLKRNFFAATSSNPAFDDIIKVIPAGETPNSMEGLHTVWENGQQRHYKVIDPTLDAALQFSPTLAQNALMTVLSLPKKIKQMTTTGILAPTFALTSPIYDTITGMVIRNKDTDLGLLNEARNRSGVNKYLPDVVKQTLGGLDPTTLITPIVGAVRQGGDEILQSIGQQVSTGIMQNNWFAQALGPQNAKALENMLNSAYYNSTKAWMDRTGASTGGLLNHSDTNSVARTIADIAPTFYSANARRAWVAAMEGDISPAAKAIETGKSVYEQARATPLARAYLHTLKLLNEGFRYQVAATNLPKVRGDAAAEADLASRVRRSAVDISQRGGTYNTAGQAAQGVVDVGLYVNPAIQSIAQIGRTFKEQPIHTTMNLATTLGALTAMTYGAAAVDPELQERMRNMTDEEVSRQAPTFGGLVIPIEPNLRPIWAGWAALMNEITGINSGQFNPDIAAALDKMLDGEMDETGQESIAASVKAGMSAAKPIDVGSFPAANMLAGLAGADIGFSRFDDAGKARIVEGQQLSQLGGEGQLVGDALSAQTMLVLNSFLSSYVLETVRAGMDADRALDQGGTPGQAVDVALSRLADTTVKGSTPIRGALFSGYQSLRSVNDTNFALWNKKSEGIDKAKAILNQDILHQFETGADPRYAQLRNIDTLPPDVSGTALAPIGAISATLTKELYGMKRQMAELQDQTENSKNQVFSTIEERNAQVNEYNEQRKALAEQMLMITRQAEDAIRQEIGDPTFSYQQFDPKKYQEMPYPAPDPTVSAPQ